MARNQDPKPGRWILPIIVVGMIGFTYFFVQTLESADAEVSDTTTTTAADVGGPTTTTEPDGSGTTTVPNTTIPAAAEGYITSVLEMQSEADAITAQLIRANDDWENRATSGVSYDETELAFVAVQDASTAFAGAVATMQGPPLGFPDAAEEHSNMVTESGNMATSAAEALAGLRSTDSGELRRAAVDDFLVFSDAFQAAGDAGIAALGG